jgi:hypothetical protein
MAQGIQKLNIPEHNFFEADTPVKFNEWRTTATNHI